MMWPGVKINYNHVGLLLISFFVFMGATSAANINVNPGSGIQNAINTANSGDTLNLSAGTYNEHDITVNKNLTIMGPITTDNNPPTAVIDAQQNGRLFKILSGTEVTLEYLLIQNGDATTDTTNPYGGGVLINSDAKLNMVNCTLKNNTAIYGGGISSKGGTVTVTDSDMFNNTATYGGGIYHKNGGIMNLTFSTVYNNTAAYGGGLFNIDGTLTVTGSDMFNNTATYGGGTYNSEGMVTVTGSNVYDNTVTKHGGGIASNQGMVTVDNSNVYDNIATEFGGGGFFNNATLIMAGSDVYHNTAEWGGGIYDSYSTVSVTGSNLYNNRANHGGGISNSYSVVTVNVSNIYDNIVSGYGGGGIFHGYGTLIMVGSDVYHNTAEWGGGIYNTYGSVYVNDSNICNNTANLVGGFYNELGMVYVIGTSVYNNTAGTNGGGIGSKEGAMTVEDSNIYNNTAAYGGGIFNTYSTVTVIDSNIFKNAVTHSGGGIFSNGALNLAILNLVNSSVYNNTATEYGGGIYNNGTLNFIMATVDNNTAGNYGGGIYNTDGTVTVSDSDVCNNTAKTGGGISNTDGTVYVIDSDVNDNTTTTGGGGISNTNGAVSVSGSEICENTAKNGGGIHNSAGTVMVADSDICENTATELGGGIYNTNSASIVSVYDSNVNDNTAGNYGGGIFNSAGKVSVFGSDISNNSAGIYGGAVYKSGSNDCVLKFCRITGNTADLGTSIFCIDGSADASLNWWGDNDNPSSKVYGPVTVAPWLILNITANPTIIEYVGTSNITADLWHDSNGGYNDPVNGHIPDGIITIFNTTLGTINSPVPTVNGAAQTTLSIDAPSGTADVSAKIDGQTVRTSVNVGSVPPKVTKFDPANGAVSVATNKVIKVTFSENIKNGSGWIDLKSNNGTVIPITMSINGNILTINHPILLVGTKYTLTLHTGSVTDLLGNPLALCGISFTTDATKPKISFGDPLSNAVNVSRDKVIKLTFSELIKAGNMWIELKSSSGTSIPLTMTISGKVLTINHTALLAAGTQYNLILHSGSITDISGNLLALVSRSFTTTTDVTAPKISFGDPLINAINVPLDKVIKLTFSELIKAGNMWIELKSSGGAVIPITISISGKVLTINHVNLLAAGTQYNLILHTGSVRDLAGNPLALVSRAFTTLT